MLRIVWSSCENDSSYSQQKTLYRTEGGWWYSEEIDDVRKTWEIRSRIPCGDDGVCEVLTPLPEDWIQQPCWQDGPPQQVQILREQGQISLQRLLADSQRQLLSLWLPLELEQGQIWPQWVQELLGAYKYTLAMRLAQSNTISSLYQGPAYPLLQKQQDLEPKAERPSQSSGQREVSRDRRPVGPQEAWQASPQEGRNKPFQRSQSQLVVSGVPKGLQTGALLTPVDLPTGQLPRNSNGRRPAHHGRPGRARQPQPLVCLLVEE